ncbi:competence type IV pilus major pilin ComGC [Facklamia miroungae]|uniref:Competence protein ComGC n=1 Tax=Facklamia miroungae TaxID=120956 RepID=A0A1G7U2U5_9LACT|nr:competence type IV pilus major pilin ComGC [Facklamia miroungae]NKZ29880.1 prepilin-type N-terminal cleavage/methylation domain-containing protein [Facklamia miroungae]SDG41698.1 competence protein ComGC [Facklamia miroungae]
MKKRVLKKIKLPNFFKNQGAFTLLEMLIVLIIVSLLMAIIIPNVSGQKDRIDQQAVENITEIVETQADAYYLVEDRTESLTLEQLVNEGYLTQKQADEAKERIDQTVLNQILSP